MRTGKRLAAAGLVRYTAFVLIYPPVLSDHLGSLRASTAANVAPDWLPAALHALIMACLARLIGRLEQLVLLWRPATLPPPDHRRTRHHKPPRHHRPTPRRHAQAGAPPTDNLPRHHARAASPPCATAIRAPTPTASFAPPGAAKPSAHPQPARAPPSVSHRNSPPERPAASAQVRPFCYDIATNYPNCAPSLAAGPPNLPAATRIAATPRLPISG